MRVEKRRNESKEMLVAFLRKRDLIGTMHQCMVKHMKIIEFIQSRIRKVLYSIRLKIIDNINTWEVEKKILRQELMAKAKAKKKFDRSAGNISSDLIPLFKQLDS